MSGIRFRVWSLEQNTYRYKFPYNSLGQFYVSESGKIFSDFGNTVAPEVEQKDFIVEQYTGLKDKNGEEIYEGDILMDDCGDPLEYWTVKYEYGKFVGETQGVVEDVYELTDLEVIGNIHENPELLRGKNENQSY